MNDVKKTTIDLGKIDFRGTGRRYPAKLQVELRTRGGEPTFTMENGAKIPTGKTAPIYTEFSACGSVGARCGGQCLDEMYKFLKYNKKFVRVYTWWKEYHLNGMHAGTPDQEKALKAYFSGGRYDYNEACEYLKTIGLYEVNFTGKTIGREYNNEPYKYGHAWIVNDIPADVLEEMRKFIDEN